VTQVISTTPDGKHAVRFQSHRPRGYWLMSDPTPLRMADDKEWGKRLDSVTKILGILDKPALPWWGMEIGIEGILTLVATGELILTRDGETYAFEITDEEARQEIMNNPDLVTDKKRIAKLLTLNKLTVNHVRDDAGDRGQDAHDAFETWVNTGILPEPRAWPHDQQGYIRALRTFIDEHELECFDTEVMVASPSLRFGGRYDVRGKLDGIISLADVKTSKRIYVSHFLQLEAYEGAGIEIGHPVTDQRVVIHLAETGEYAIVRAEDVSKDGEPCTYSDFEAIVHTYNVVKRLGGL
jgi:hypothetical protein